MVLSMKQNKNLTIKQRKNKYRAIQYSTYATQYAAIAAPYGALIAVNWDKWFMANPESYKIGIGGTIALVLVSLAVFLVTNMKAKNKEVNGYIAIIIAWFMTGFIFKLLGMIMLEIADIMFITGSGLIAAFGLDIGSEEAKKKADKMKKALTDAEAELDKEEAKEEIEEEKRKKRYF